jgi:hypothetical protein
LQAAPAQGSFQVPDTVKQPGPPPRKAGWFSAILSLLHLAKPLQFGPDFVGERRELPDNGLDEILLNNRGVPERHLPFFEWQEQIPDAKAEYAAAAARHIEVDRADGALVDSDDTDFLKILTEAPNPNHVGRRSWAVYWLRPLWDDLRDEYRFQVKHSNAPAIVSLPFRVDLSDTGQPHPVCPAAGCAPAAQAGRPKPIPPLRRHRVRPRKIG